MSITQLSSEQHAVLQRFPALAALPERLQARLWAAAAQLQLPAGASVFLDLTAEPEFSHFLVDGRVRLTGPRQQVREIDAETPEALRPLELGRSAGWNCVTMSVCRILQVPNAVLELLLEQARFADTYVVREIESVSLEAKATSDEPPADMAVDWMERLLQTPFFRDIPAASIYGLFQRLEPVSVGEGEVLIQQGEPGQHFFILSRGRAEVLRQQPSGQWVRLAIKQPGEGFGEEALLSDQPRNATVRMLTHGEVRRLSADDFESLLKNPVLVRLTAAEAAEKITTEHGVWLDVRSPEAYQNDGLPGTLHIPLPLLRSRMGQLGQRPIVVLCDQGYQSNVAVYLLRERGLDAWMLQGGVEALREYRRFAKG